MVGGREDDGVEFVVFVGDLVEETVGGLELEDARFRVLDDVGHGGVQEDAVRRGLRHFGEDLPVASVDGHGAFDRHAD